MLYTAGMQTAVRLESVHVIIGKAPILSDISLALPRGQIIGLLGPSGAGKTTLIRTIIGRQRIASGMAEILDESPTSSSLREQLGYMTQGAAFYDDLTTRQNLAYFATMRSAAISEVDEILAAVDLSAQAKQLASTLSGGQRSRLSLAIALLGKPQLILLDEPTVGVDPVLRRQLWKLFRQLSSNGATVIISSHIMDEAELCDELVLLRDGRMLAQGSPQQLCNETQTDSVEEAFLQLAGGTA